MLTRVYIIDSDKMQYAKLMVNIVAVYSCCVVEASDEDPLILTPLLEAGKFKEAQEKSVVPYLGGIRSYTGFFTVNEKCESNLFFWFIPALKNWESAPVILWLNGGPGTPSLVGLFFEIGPFSYDKKKGLVNNKHHWSIDHNLIFLDQPVGTGFSFTKKNCLAKDLTVSSREAYEALRQFFQLFPNLRNNAFFIVGESFAGHYIPALAVEIDKRNVNTTSKINLVGILVGNPLIDVRCHHLGEYGYQLGILDEKTRDTMEKDIQNVTKYVNLKDYENAGIAYGNIWRSLGHAGLPSIYNILSDNILESTSFQLFVSKYSTRKQIHVGLTEFNPENTNVYYSIVNDIYTPSNHYYEHLLKANTYIVGLYNGHLDIVCQYSSIPCVLRQLQWPDAADYRAANRSQWYVGGRLAGWYKTAGNLFEVVFRDSGHFVPTDQPEAALEFIRAATADRPGSRLLSRLNTEP